MTLKFLSFQVVGIMVKRGSVEDQGEDRGRLLTEVEQLVSAGDNTMVSLLFGKKRFSEKRNKNF